MKTIVLNTINGAVTEYSGFSFRAITPTHAASPQGLFTLGGDTDAGTPIVATVRTGRSTLGSLLKKNIDIIFFAVEGSGTLRGLVVGQKLNTGYNFTVEVGGVSRCKPGRGIRENYLAVGLSNPNGQFFRLDSIELRAENSNLRRTQ